MTKNSAFVFVKPHAVTDATIALVKTGLAASGLTILSEGSLTAEVIDSKKLIDQHYYAIASKATILKPNELNVPTDKFEAQFGLSWESALAEGNVYNAMDACEKLGITADEMDAQWGICKKAKKLIKFGGGERVPQCSRRRFIFIPFPKALIASARACARFLLRPD